MAANPPSQIVYAGGATVQPHRSTGYAPYGAAHKTTLPPGVTMYDNGARPASVKPHEGFGSAPLAPSTTNNRPYADPLDFESFGSSLNMSKPSKSSKSSSSSSSNPYRTAVPKSSAVPSTNPYASYIKPATPGAFGPNASQTQPKQMFSQPASHAANHSAHGNGHWPTWLTDGRPNPILAHNGPVPPPVSKPKPKPEDDVPREEFNIDSAPITAEDYQRFTGDAEKHMQELLSGAIGEGEGDMGDAGAQEGEDIIEGFAQGIKLMPHQVRGVKWMRNRESGRKYGGILADDMGLGKTVQTLARIVEGTATTAEKKAGFRGGTLIIAPLAVMEQWASEVKTKTEPGRLKVSTHHGPSRTKSGKTLEKFDVIITTFQTVASEFGIHETAAQKRLDNESDSDVETGRKGVGAKKKKKQAACPLFEVKWLRVVIDEAQNIKNRNTRAAKAAVALKAKYRWCLTGLITSQNNVEELFSLFKFLRARPLDDWETFRERIGILVKNGQVKLAMKRLHIVLKAIMLRRTKDATIDGKKILNLPGRTVQVTPCAFDAEERAFYDALEKKTELTFNKFVRSGTAMANYTSVLTLLLRLRQACVHPSLVTKSLSVDAEAITDGSSQPKEVTEAPDQADELADLLGGLGVASGKTCQMCFVKLQDPSATHCDACADIARQAEQKSQEADDGLPPTSAKIRMLLKLLAEIDERSGSKEKTIVFSQFTSFLDLIEPFLKRHSIAYVRYDGSMRNDKRQESLEKIKNHPGTRVILISFKAGSTGLNLTCCNNVVLMDLWWNPALEDQAFDRAHRLGQKLDVNIFKLTIEETVEDRILTLQNNKRELANAALSGNGAKGLMKLTMNDIMKLFTRSHSHKHDDEDDDDSD
ncbi:hypothetical protein I317_04101 [Kwoniella heveanensis CBS 569]|nr:hypothetical protein I317_04101 [Kwoniella heveanensis CBS 569]